VPLRLVAAGGRDRLECRLLDASNATLVDGVVGPPAAGGADGPPPRATAGQPLPVSSTCFACGVDNARGLRVRLGHDEARVGGAWRPLAAFRAGDGTLAPVALTTLLDETAFWLGALASGESGMTTELAVTLPAPVPFGPTITVAGSRARVRARPDDPRYWDTEIEAWDETGRLAARARITFVAVRGAGRRLAAWLLPVNAPEVVRAVFPTYA
jgi:acyl-coenzyme A thioesterase PaaI-like protein